jgi:acetoin utilization deacetylase AcuC-like enzyme
MRIITDELCTSYASPGHPEKPERISRTQLRLRDQDALTLTWEEPVQAPETDLLRAHDPEYLRRLAEDDADFDTDTPWHRGIYDHARSSAGAAVQAMAAARRGEAVFSLMRPPGHHATRKTAMGFCYLGSVAVAALAAVAAGCRRVAVYDFDVHHGNGTEDILLGQPGTCFASIHQYPCYPGTGTRDLGDNVFNFPVAPLTPRKDYRRVLAAALERLAAQRPDLVLVSAGFDAYVHDPISQETLEVEDFHWVGGQLRALGLPVCSLLEGGYSHDLPELILAYLCGLEGK